jgi:hypothetical protein
VLLASAVMVGCAEPPQIAGDEECMRATDALWTAVTSKRMPLLDNCAKKIEGLHAEGRLANDAHEQLAAIVATARAGEWDSARKTLKAFIVGQRPKS